MLAEYIEPIVASAFTALATWLLTRKKNTAETHLTEVETATKSAAFYQQLLDDLQQRYQNAVEQLERSEKLHQQTFDELKKAYSRIGELEKEVTRLVSQLNKYKQLRKDE